MKAFVYVICIAALALTFWWVSGTALRDLVPVEILVAAAAIVAVAARWRMAVRKRKQRKIEEMRDSALW